MTAFKMKDGMSMRDYCLKEGISYNIAYRRCDECGMTPEEAVEEARHPNPKNRKHYVDGVILKQLCDQKGVRYQAVIDVIRRKKVSADIAFYYVYKRDCGVSK